MTNESEHTPRPAVATPAEVTDEMVERAAKKHMEVRSLGMLRPWETCTEETRESYRSAMRRALESAALTAQCQARKDTQGLDDRRDYRAEMKNFHRSLCERFGYTHDEIDWFRDQVSLEEFIAKRLEAALAAQRPAGVPEAKPKLIGWRMADYTAETSDPEKAKNWSSNVTVLPIFESDPNTKLAAAPEVPRG